MIFLLCLIVFGVLVAFIDWKLSKDWYKNWNPNYYYYIWDELFQTVSWLTPSGVWHYKKHSPSPFEVQTICKIRYEDLRKRNFKVFERQLEYLEKKLFEGCVVPKDLIEKRNTTTGTFNKLFTIKDKPQSSNGKARV